MQIYTPEDLLKALFEENPSEEDVRNNELEGYDLPDCDEGVNHGGICELSFQHIDADIVEYPGQHEILINLPGYEKESIHIEVQNDTLVVIAKPERPNLKKGIPHMVRTERYRGTCERYFTLSKEADVNAITSTFRNGVLEIVIPKRNVGPVKRTIMVQ